MSLPERHCEPYSHEHECRPFIFRVEAGENVIPDLRHQKMKTHKWRISGEFLILVAGGAGVISEENGGEGMKQNVDECNNNLATVLPGYTVLQLQCATQGQHRVTLREDKHN